MSLARTHRLAVFRDAGLYLVTDDRVGATARRQVVAQALEAGVRVVQLRDKRSLGRALLREAVDLTEMCHACGAILLINDRVDVAVASGADGVHVGQEDLPLDVARRLVGRDHLVGVSASTVAEAIAADREGADYVGFGAMFPTATKVDAEYAGPELLREVKQQVSVPVAAIGGISIANLPRVLAAGADLAAVVTAISEADDPFHAARTMLALVRAARN
jgi:thiamine-phosphate pyrophosphorylase